MPLVFQFLKSIKMELDCVYSFVSSLFCSMLLPVAALMFIFTVNCSLCDYATTSFSLHPDGLMAVSRVCIMNRAAMIILFRVFRYICARVFLGCVVI